MKEKNSFKIGNIEIDNRVVLAPMAGVCDNAFRTICKDFGVGLIYTEMVSDKAVVYENKKTLDMLYMTEGERPLGIQVFGSDKESFTKAAKFISENTSCDFIDINMGCPVPKVAQRAQAGSALLKDPEKVFEIVSAVVNAVEKPVTVKIRSGWDKSNINAVEIAKICEKAGAQAIAVHGRTRSQMYEGFADWDVIKAVKESVNIPVIGNGDVVSALKAKEMFDYTGCDAVMIGRAAQGNPWIFKQITIYLETGELIDEPTKEEKITICKEHLNRLIRLKGEKIALKEMRAHASWYLKGLRDSARVKNLINQTNTKEELIKVLDDYNSRL